eukprot:jgi/Chlat1/4837/Chrsp31S04872
MSQGAPAALIITKLKKSLSRRLSRRHGEEAGGGDPAADSIRRQDEATLAQLCRSKSLETKLGRWASFTRTVSGKFGSSKASGCAMEAGHLKRGGADVLGELHQHYKGRGQRRKGYRNLFAFIAFTALYLSMLSLQRNSSTSYPVNKTLIGLVPRDPNYQIYQNLVSVDLLWGWLQGVLTGPTWMDPKCGDGVCEPPYEVQGYGRHGCPQDCGWSQLVTRTEVKLYYSFQDTATLAGTYWNLCGTCSKESMADPVNSDCWFDDLQTFANRSGVVTAQMYLPDGVWNICLIAPQGGVRGVVTPLSSSPSELQAIALSANGFSTTVEGNEDTPQVINTAATGTNTSIGGWGFCGDTITACKKKCLSVGACFMRCPIEGYSATDIQNLCEQHCAEAPFANITDAANCELDREKYVIAMGITPSAANFDSYGEYVNPCQAVYDNYDYAKNLQTADTCGAFVPNHFCKTSWLGDGRCDTDCLTESCGFDWGDCCLKDWPIGDGTACCNLLTSTADSPSAQPFELVNYSAEQKKAENALNQDTVHNARWRTIGVTNRVIAGMLIHQTRWAIGNCSNERFSQLLPRDGVCTAKTLSLEPYGVDPVFLKASTLYNSSAVDERTRFYSDSEVNNRGVPYGFFPSKVKGYEDGFPVFIDINLSQQRAEDMFSYLQDGFFIDIWTKAVVVQFVTYNGDLDYFSSLRLKFAMVKGGFIQVLYSVQTVSVELYKTSIQRFRLCLELLYLMCVVFGVYSEAHELIQSKRKKGSYLAYLNNFWNYIDCCSIMLQITGIVLWVVMVADGARTFSTGIRYNVYEPVTIYSATQPPRALQLVDNGAGLKQVADVFAAVHNLINMQQAYMFFNGINIILMIARVIKLMDFQPRMGLITRTLSRAAYELFHFFFLASIVFVSYGTLAYLAFGHLIFEFSTLGRSLVTCFELLLGRIEINEDLMLLNGFELALSQIFFWTFEIIVFMILLNFLLAILIDAFTDITKDAKRCATMPEEVKAIVLDHWRGSLYCAYKDYVSDSHMLSLLKRWLAPHLSAQQAKAAENELVREPVLHIGRQEVTVEAIEDILHAIAKDTDDEDMPIDEMVATLRHRFNERQKTYGGSGELDPRGAAAFASEPSPAVSTLYIRQIQQQTSVMQDQLAAIQKQLETLHASQAFFVDKFKEMNTAKKEDVITWPQTPPGDSMETNSVTNILQDGSDSASDTSSNDNMSPADQPGANIGNDRNAEGDEGGITFERTSSMSVDQTSRFI